MNAKTRWNRIGWVGIVCCAGLAVAEPSAQPRPERPKAGAAARPAPGGPRRPPLPKDTKVLRDIEFAKVGDKSLKLDLYLPDHPKGAKLPLVIWIHGGAWRTGSKEGAPAVQLLPAGFAAASISYRLSQEAIFPAQIHDCKAAVRWLRAHAAEYDLDPARFGAWGSSAGGHLVALLGASGGVKELEGAVGGNLDQPSNVQAVCDFFGPTDFLAMVGQGSTINHGAADSPESKLIGGTIGENPDKVKAANPITYVTKDDPPFLIVHGDADRTVPPNQSKLLQEALTKAGVEATLYMVAGGGHGGFRDPKVPELVQGFFTKHLKGSAGAAAAPAAKGD